MGSNKLLNTKKSFLQYSDTIRIKDEILSADLKKGQAFLHDRQDITKQNESKFNLLEGFQTNYSSNELWNNGVVGEKNVQQVIQNEMDELKKLENNFQDTLSEYSRTYNSYMSEIMNDVKREKNKYIGKTIITPNGDSYYVNNFGVARGWFGKIWNNYRGKNCSGERIRVNTDNIKDLGLTIGKPMRENEPCGYAGQNIRVSMEKSQLINLARQNGAMASQSSRHSSTKWPAHNAVDGNQNTFNHTKKGVGEWWQVKLAKRSFIDSIKIYNRKDCCQNRFTKVQLDIRDDNNDIIYSSTINRTQNDQLIFEIKNINKQGRTIRLTQEKDNFLHMGEVEVWGTQETTVTQGRVGYVTKDGILREYPNSNMENTSGTCPSYVKNIDEETWNAMTKGENMEIDTLCALGNMDLSVRQKLVSLNEQLIELSETIYNKIEQTKNTITTINEQKGNESEYLNEQLQRFRGLFNEFNQMKGKEPTLNAMVQDEMLKNGSKQYHYLGWSLFAILLLIVALRNFRRT